MLTDERQRALVYLARASGLITELPTVESETAAILYVGHALLVLTRSCRQNSLALAIETLQRVMADKEGGM